MDKDEADALAKQIDELLDVEEKEEKLEEVEDEDMS